MNNIVKLLLLGLLLLGLGIAVGRYTLPERVRIEKEYVEIDKSKETTDKKTDTNTQKKQQTHIIETTFPDGKYTKETFILNEETVVIKEQVHVEVEKIKEILKRELKDVSNYKPQWSVAGLYNFKNDYGAQIERRIIGPVFMGLYYNNVLTNRDLGASVRVEF